MSSFTTHLSPTQGFHPAAISKITFPSSALSSCSLHLHFALPPLLFVDPHELTERSLSYLYNHWGSRDLEKPVHALPGNEQDSEVLLTVKLLEHDDDSQQSGFVTSTVELPMHVRYGVPVNRFGEENYAHVHVSWPSVFLQCSSSSPLANTTGQGPTPPLPYHVLSTLSAVTPSNLIIPIPPRLSHLSSPAQEPGFAHNNISIPLGSRLDLLVVEPGTAFTVLVCFSWLALASLKAALRLAGGRHHHGAEKLHEKKS
ncbi:PIG-X [Crassisporium funariophilum]|nr:PIG-X [Crassisporium funariophilum]